MTNEEKMEAFIAANKDRAAETRALFERLTSGVEPADPEATLQGCRELAERIEAKWGRG